MTRATLLQLLAHPTALTGADVRALEQLAAAFPYCQTAHLLLAKAAHDQDSMLAGQRLRRAATYAANRTLLRALLEQTAPALAVAEPVAAAAPPATLAPPATAAADTTSENALAVPNQVLEDKPDQVIGQPAPSELLVAAPTLAEPAAEEVAPVVGVVELLNETAEPAAEATEPVVEVFEPVAEATEPITEATEPVAEAVEAAPAAMELAELAAEPAVEAELPPQAPPIRPPAEAATAYQEFGLAPEEPTEIMAYRLPELAEEPSQPGTPLPAPATPRLPAFTGVPEVGYAPAEGSRLGFCLTLPQPDELLPSAALPPAHEFFAPDALLLAHVAAHQPPAAPKASSLDLINSFLQRAPAPTRRRVAPLPTAPEPDAQADLSVRSTRAEPDLASESLAKILARQGKTDRAIAVYERLMVKQPEKMAYFAAQIESLRPSA